MRSKSYPLAAILACLLPAALLAQQPATSPAAASKNTPAATSAATASKDKNPAEMMAQMMKYAQPSEKHKLLEPLTGDWDYKVKMWMEPGAEPMQSSGTASRRAEMGGRYYIADVKGKFEMPGPDGKMMPMDFKGMGIDGYDNVKEKFLQTWIDNMSTGIMLAEGSYDPSTRTFTYTADLEMLPGETTKTRQVVKIIDQDHHTMEWYENRGGKEVKTMEIAYTRKK